MSTSMEDRQHRRHHRSRTPYTLPLHHRDAHPPVGTPAPSPRPGQHQGDYHRWTWLCRSPRRDRLLCRGADRTITIVELTWSYLRIERCFPASISPPEVRLAMRRKMGGARNKPATDQAARTRKVVRGRNDPPSSSAAAADGENTERRPKPNQ